MKRFATHCDTEIKWFDTLEEAEAEALQQIEVSRRERHDGWDEELTEGIVVMQLVRRAVKVDPNADYRCVDYRLATIEPAELSNEGTTHGCHICGEERIPARVSGYLVCPECHSDKLVCIEN